MSNFKNICIATDGTKTDSALYAAVWKMDGSVFQIEQIHILHVRKTTDSERRLFRRKSELVDVLEADVQSEQEKMKADAIGVFGDAFADRITVHLLTGSPANKALDFITEHGVDCLIVGKKKRKKGSGRFAKEFLRRTKIPVMLIPDQMPGKWKLRSVLVPFDFSDHSEHALAAANSIRSSTPDVKVECFTVLDYPMFTGDRYGDADPIVKADVQGQQEIFDTRMEALGLEDRPDFKIQVIYGNYIARAVVQRAKKGSFSLMVMGAVGHSAFGRMFLGSVAERVISMVRKTPLLIIS